jgi:hypothetical protein
MRRVLLIALSLLLAHCAAAQDPRSLVRQVVQNEIVASNDDHSRWAYYDVDRKPEGAVEQWVAETENGSVHRILVQKGVHLSPPAQRSSMDQFINDTSAQSRQRKSDEHDDRQSEDLLKILPDAFTWTIASTDSATVLLHFAPDPSYSPPSWAARVFAAMEGTLRFDKKQRRIISLQGRLVRNVRFCGGLCGGISAGGTFAVERREIGPSIWQIVATHVHIHGSVLFFKSISQDEDDEKTRFQRLPENISLQQAETKLLQENESGL